MNEYEYALRCTSIIQSADCVGSIVVFRVRPPYIIGNIEILENPADQVPDEFLRQHSARTQRERHSTPDVRVLATID